MPLLFGRASVPDLQLVMSRFLPPQPAIPAIGQASRETRKRAGNPGFSRIHFRLWVGVMHFPGTAIQDNLADKAKRLGIPVWRFGGA